MNHIDIITLNQLNQIVSRIDTIVQHSSVESLDNDTKEMIYTTARQINFQLYMSEVINIPITDIESHLPIWTQSIERRKATLPDCDFWGLYEYFKYVDEDTIYNNTLAIFQSYPEEYKREFLTLPNRYTFLTGKLDIETDDYSLISIYVKMMKDELDGFKSLYEKLADNRSKIILLRIVRFWFQFNLNDLLDLHETTFSDYFDLDLIQCNENEVFADCGAYIGDTISDYINTYGQNYKKIYAYEINDSSMAQLQSNLIAYNNIIYRQYGVGKCKDTMFLDDNLDGASSKISNTGSKAIGIVSLDEDIKEPLTIIKMDIEGAEQEALLGASRHIKEDKPKLMICTYHKPEDLFQIPKLIENMRDDYKYYLRFNGRGIWPCDHVLFAI